MTEKMITPPPIKVVATGISFKNKSSFFSFPEQRIESDSFIFWETYENSLETQIQKKHKLTKDLDNGFNTSLYP